MYFKMFDIKRKYGTVKCTNKCAVRYGKMKVLNVSYVTDLAFLSGPPSIVLTMGYKLYPVCVRLSNVCEFRL